MQTNMKYCAHRAEECDCYLRYRNTPRDENPNHTWDGKVGVGWFSVMGVHSLYYLKPADALALVASTKMQSGYFVVHRFEGTSGTHANEQSWRRNDQGMIVARNGIGSVPYVHGNMDFWQEHSSADGSIVGLPGCFSWEYIQAGGEIDGKPHNMVDTYILRIGYDANINYEPRSQEWETVFDEGGYIIQRPQGGLFSTWRWAPRNNPTEYVHFDKDIFWHANKVVLGRKRDQKLLRDCMDKVKQHATWKVHSDQLAPEVAAQMCCDVTALVFCEMEKEGKMIRSLNRRTGHFRHLNRMYDEVMTHVSWHERLELLWRKTSSWLGCCKPADGYDNLVIRNTVPRTASPHPCVQIRETVVKPEEVTAIPAGPVSRDPDNQPIIYKTDSFTLAQGIQERIIKPQEVCNQDEYVPDAAREKLAWQCVRELWKDPDEVVKPVKTCPDTWVAQCPPAKREKMKKGLATIRERGLKEQDAAINLFTKTENCLKKENHGIVSPDLDNIPRMIADRSAEYTTAQAYAFQSLGKILKLRCPTFNQKEEPSPYVYASGCNVADLNQWMLAAIETLQSRTDEELVFLMRDASKWDGHNSEWMVNFSAGEKGYWHEMTKYLIWDRPIDKRNFIKAVNYMPKNNIRSMQGKLRAKLGDGARKSGDGCTSCGNSTDNIVTDMVGIKEMGVDPALVMTVVLGDDALTIGTASACKQMAAFYATNPFGMNYKKGANVSITPLNSDYTGVAFCSMPVWSTKIGPQLGSDPDRLLRKTFWSRSLASMKDVTPAEKQFYCKTVATGLLASCAAVDGLYDVIKAMADMKTPAISNRKAKRLIGEIKRDKEYKLYMSSSTGGTDRQEAGNLEEVVSRSRILSKISVQDMVKSISEKGYYVYDS
jgi:hypothetical protein